MRLATATLPAFAAAAVWLALGPYPWPVNPYPGWVQWVAALLALAVISLAGSQHRALAARPLRLESRLGLVSALLPLVSALLIWLWLAPQPWPVNPYPYPWPRNPYAWPVRWVLPLIAFGLVALVGSELTLAQRARAWMERRALALLLAGMALALAYGWASALIRYLFFDGDTDLSIYPNMCWNASQGRLYEWLSIPYLALHVTAVPALLLPFCPLGQPGLLFAQSLLLTMAALPLFFLARHHVGPFPSLLLAWSYLALPGVFAQHTNTIVEGPLIALPLALSFLFYRQRRLTAFLVSATVGATAIVEYYAPVFGLFALLAGRQRRSPPWVIGPLCLAILWPALAYGIIQPYFKTVDPTQFSSSFAAGLSYYRHLGTSPDTIVAQVVGDPGQLLALLTQRLQLAYLYELLAPFLFVLPWGSLAALFALWELALVFPAVESQHLLLSGGHAGLASTALLAGTMGSLGWLARRSLPESAALVRALAAAVLVLAAASQVTVEAAVYPLHRLRQPREALMEAVALVPPDLPVAAPGGVVPHLVNRRELYYLWQIEDRVREAQLAAVLFHHPVGQLVEEFESRTWEAVRRHPAYRLAYQRDGVTLFLRVP